MNNQFVNLNVNDECTTAVGGPIVPLLEVSEQPSNTQDDSSTPQQRVLQQQNQSAEASQSFSGVPAAAGTSNNITTTPGNAFVEPQQGSDRTNLYVCSLPAHFTDKELFELFSPFGPVESAKVMLDIHTGASRGIAFVKFRTIAAAACAIEALNGRVLDGRPITVRIANARAAYKPGQATNKVFVRNVPPDATTAHLMALFSPYGKVLDISLHADTAPPRTNTDSASQNINKPNIAFITFESVDSAMAAANSIHHTTPFPSCQGIPVLAKVAEDSVRRSERMAHRQSRQSISSTGSAPELPHHHQYQQQQQQPHRQQQHQPQQRAPQAPPTVPMFFGTVAPLFAPPHGANPHAALQPMGLQYIQPHHHAASYFPVAYTTTTTAPQVAPMLVMPPPQLLHAAPTAASGMPLVYAPLSPAAASGVMPHPLYASPIPQGNLWLR